MAQKYTNSITIEGLSSKKESYKYIEKTKTNENESNFNVFDKNKYPIRKMKIRKIKYVQK